MENQIQLQKISELSFSVYTTPIACQRPRFVRKTGRTYTDKKTYQYKQTVAHAASKAMYGKEKLEGPLAAHIIAYMPIPKTYPQWKRDLIEAGDMRPTSTPDTDNLAKGVMDSMNGLVFRDDAEIVHLTVEKRFGNNPRVVVNVFSWAEGSYCSNLKKKPVDNDKEKAQELLL